MSAVSAGTRLRRTHVLGEAAACDTLSIDKAEHYYLAAITLAEELEMRPLLARNYLGIGRLYLRAGDRDRAEDHLLTATRLFSAMDMPFWIRQAASSLRELGRDMPLWLRQTASSLRELGRESA